MKQVARLSFPGPSIAWVLAAAFAALLLALAGGGGRAAAASADCRFVLGFKALHAMIPDTVGACLENEQHHPIEGVTLQRTTNGLLVWHKAANRTAFTDGYRTWVRGPFGLRQRLNTEQFPWERAAENVIRIGAAVSETGRYTREGNDVRQGYRLWLDWVNNEYGGIKVGADRYKVELVLYDDEGDGDTTARLVEQLITEDNVDFLLGPYTSGLTLSAAKVAEKHGKIMVEGHGASETIFAQGFQHLFSVLTPAGDYTQSALQMLAAKGAKTVVIAHTDTAFATSVAAGTRRWAAAYGLEVLSVEAYPQGAADVSDIVSQFKELGPDVFVGGGHFNDALLFIRTAKALDFSPQAMVLTVGPSNPQLISEVGSDADYAIGPTQWEASMSYRGAHFGSASDYAARYQEMWGQAPTYQAAGSTAAALALHLDIEAAGSLDTDAVRTALHSLDVATFYGPISFDETGKNTAKPMGTIQVQHGEILVVAPSNAAVAELLYPAPAWAER